VEVYYLLYADDYEIPSKVAIHSEVPSFGRVRADSVAPPHCPTSIKRCISIVEGNPALVWHADLFADTSCDAPLKEGHISFLCADGPGLNPNKPMAIVQVKNPSIQDGKYLIKNRENVIYWNAAGFNPITTVYFYFNKKYSSKEYLALQWDITQDANGNISIKSLMDPFSWVGADMTGSRVPVPWRLIQAFNNNDRFYYLTTDMNRDFQNPQVPATYWRESHYNVPGSMATLEKGDPWQMWEFIRV